MQLWYQAHDDADIQQAGNSTLAIEFEYPQALVEDSPRQVGFVTIVLVTIIAQCSSIAV